MKSLVESIFGDNVKSEWTFRDIFKFVRADLPEKPHDDRQTLGKNWTIDNLYHWKLIAKEAKVQGDSPEDVVVRGLVNLIYKLKVSPATTCYEFEEQLKPFTKYYKSIVNNTLRLRIHSKPYLFNCGSNSMDTDTEYTLNDIADDVEISFCKIRLFFTKK